MKTTITELGRSDSIPNEPVDEGFISRAIIDITVDLTMLRDGVERVKVQVHGLLKSATA